MEREVENFVDWGFKGDALIWWKSFHHSEWMSLSEEALEKLLLDKWSHTKSKDKDITKSLFSCGKSILQVHGCIHKENVIVSINPSCNKILSIFSWLIDCKFLQRIFKAHRLRVKMLKFLKI
jgi:hypothetical protein